MVVVVVVGTTVVGGRVVGASVGAAKITKIIIIWFSIRQLNLKLSIDLPAEVALVVVVDGAIVL